MLVGRSVAIAVQTRSELLIWPGVHGWSADRAERLRDQLDNGHALGQQEHVADRWVAATAIAIRRPLLTGDGIYLATPGLELLPLGRSDMPPPNPH